MVVAQETTIIWYIFSESWVSMKNYLCKETIILGRKATKKKDIYEAQITFLNSK